MEWEAADGILFCYERTDHGAVLCRCFGTAAELIVPDLLGELPVTAVADYAFAPDCHRMINIPSPLYSQPAEEAGRSATENSGDAGELIHLPAICGRALRGVILPDGLKKVGRSAFYQCRKLEWIVLPGCLEELGGDAFMNCLKLRHLYINRETGEKTLLKQVLTQVTWTAEVSFRKESFVFPEYLEHYEEIGPAHVFELQVSGQGFRMRQCFLKGCFQPEEFDRCFQLAAREEKESLLCQMALAGMQRQNAGGDYAAYLKESEETEKLLKKWIEAPEEGLNLTPDSALLRAYLAGKACAGPEDFLPETQLVRLTDLLADPSAVSAESTDDPQKTDGRAILGRENVKGLIQRASELGRAELALSLMEIIRKLPEEKKADPYSFDEW